MNRKDAATGSAFLVFVLAGLMLSGCGLSRLGNPFSGGPEDMVLIPGGYFFLGSDQEGAEGDPQAGIDEIPRHKTYTPSYYIDRYEVTEAQYLEFLQATGSKKYPGYWVEAGRADRYPEGYANHPVSDIDWFDARAYCKWAGKRLPTEREWEKAARGTDGRVWPWGNLYREGRANIAGVSAQWASPKGQEVFPVQGWKAPVGSHPEDRSPYGVYDMAGNVQEWTASFYSSYPGNPVRKVEKNDRFRVLRGGSYLAKAEFSRAAFRTAVMPTIGPLESDGWHSDYTYGFRCAKN
ncbi:MAG TPA: SUMF1/EgtB/PvdO family nonheme iron enzyme [Nitrospiria bacterium]